MMNQNDKKRTRTARQRRIRARISGTAKRPRLSVLRSLQSFSVQAIDDGRGVTVAAASIRDLGKKTKNTTQAAGKLGGLIAERLAKLGIAEAVLDRSGYRYHGKVKALAEGAREKGLKI